MNQIGIYAKCFRSSLDDFIRTGEYRALPIVVCTVNGQKPEGKYVEIPFTVFKYGMKREHVENIFKIHGESTHLLSDYGQSYQILTQIVNKNMDKVIADLISCLIVEKIKEYKDEDNYFFISDLGSNKLIGRLGYLYLNQDKNTVCFVISKGNNLITNILSKESNSLELDINYFKLVQDMKTNHNKKSDQSEIIPENPMESMIQTVFFQISGSQRKNIILRMDLFSQGITKNIIRKKIDDINDIISYQPNLSEPFMDSSTSEMVRMPKVLFSSRNAMDELYNNRAKKLLAGEKT